jgi:hypothetical protein
MLWLQVRSAELPRVALAATGCERVVATCWRQPRNASGFLHSCLLTPLHQQWNRGVAVFQWPSVVPICSSHLLQLSGFSRDKFTQQRVL